MSITLIAVGDISFGDSPKCFGFGVKRIVEKNGADFIFEKIKHHLNADIIFGNLETVLSNDQLVHYNFNSDQMRGSVECIDSLGRAGFNVLNIANNHILQHGENAFWDCINRLRKENISIVGLRGKDKYFSEPAIIDIDGERIGFLGYSFEEDNTLGHSANIAYAYCAEPVQVLTDVNILQKQVDTIVVSLHWGLEFAPYPSKNLVEIAHNIVDAGADVILGHHPHVVQCIEEYNKKIICYSLGNFVFDMAWNKNCQRSMLIKLKLKGATPPIISEQSPLTINKTYQPTPSTNTNCVLRRISKICADIYTETGQNEEYEYYTYYKKVAIQQLKDSLLSNIFLLITLISRTPLKYMPGKVLYLWNKSFKKFFQK